jgi:hypothetical protein
MRRLVVVSLIGILSSSADLAAQGALSMQGYGYPPGQFSTAVFGSGGAFGEFDPQSPINPAALGLWRTTTLFGQYQPELRRVSGGDLSTSTVTSRFPLFGGIMPLRQRWNGSISISTLFDRTWSTRSTIKQLIGNDSVVTFQSARAAGALNDVRAGVSFSFSPRVTLGVGAHYFVGRNSLTFRQTYEDTIRFTGISQTNTLTFQGVGVSAGAVLTPARGLSLALSARTGGTVKARSTTDTVLATADVPTRFGAGLKYDFRPGSSIGLRASHEGWSSLRSLGSSQMTAFDSWDVSAGTDIAGIGFLPNTVVFRAGTQYRTLPFGYLGQEVKELAFSSGLGFALSKGTAVLDVGGQYANRTPGSGPLKERAFTFSFGLRIRP